ncbi:uncharacterized protein LOC108203376 [Daucus carota subsp. sativus]|uniref:uncharacterized protein LOC108203376 n=1 Tax=Daucus carota subsp. sativus TaxID=79200 RepID=UPI0007EF23C2|nr:PREDICTED: uncharacterized protein LOC108203376 [Daucus carota subsp. sativus]
MSDDILYSRRQMANNMNLQLDKAEIYSLTLTEIEKLLNDVGKSLRDFSTLLYLDERAFIRKEEVYSSCMDVEDVGLIVLPVASSGIAATLLPGGRTAHSRFHITLKIDRHSIAGIKHGSPLAELIKQTSLIIWDEASMQHRHAFESVDRSLRDVMSSLYPSRAGISFGGISIMFGGDYRKILPERAEVFLLKKNMRLSLGKTAREKKEIADFSQWVLDVRNGRLPIVHPDNTINDPDVVIPDKFLIHSYGQLIKDIVDVIYPNISSNISNTEFLKQRSILTPTNAIVNDVNSYILDQLLGVVHAYFS